MKEIGGYLELEQNSGSEFIVMELRLTVNVIVCDT